eukprot:TRINITY_DN822_c0_g1_i1.p1 TRINITY_DN822_c0_g1~~TRINITY_DN822_c0_g1_i1.p1  ORF type:complete len:130 (+),score=14.98 TRINITY_DN822_c0_g1_i1:620-1009(+)
MEGLAMTSTAIVNLFHCFVESPVTQGKPANASFKELNSTNPITSFTNSFLITQSTLEGRRSHAEYRRDSLATELRLALVASLLPSKQSKMAQISSSVQISPLALAFPKVTCPGILSIHCLSLLLLENCR